MSCGSLTETIFDMARGAAVPAAARVSVQRHMEACRSCAAEYARQRQLTAGLQTLAAEAQKWAAPAAIEERLLAAFAAAHAPAAAPHDRPAIARAGRAWMYSLATAAVVTLAVWAGVRGVQIFRSTEAMRPETGALVNGGSGERKTAGEVVNARTGERDPAGELTKRRAGEPKATEPVRRRPRPSRNAAPAAAPVEFVRIPSAIGLPDLESGTVVRVELALAALPQYGLEIAPDAMRTSIEADVLVGQDGQPR